MSFAPWTHPHHIDPVKCLLTTIGELTRDWQRLDQVKIDAEGAELAVWHGMQESLRRFPNAVVVIELHFDRAAAEVHELLSELQRAAASWPTDPAGGGRWAADAGQRAKSTKRRASIGRYGCRGDVGHLEVCPLQAETPHRGHFAWRHGGGGGHLGSHARQFYKATARCRAMIAESANTGKLKAMRT